MHQLTWHLLSLDQHFRALFVFLKVSTGEVKQLGPPRLYTAVAPSPDGQYLLVAWLERPFSYNVPCGRFPKRIQLWDKCGILLLHDLLMS